VEEENFSLRQKIKRDEFKLNMIIHDLKHPTEALAEGLHGLSKSLKVQKSEA
jgi:hypothetical protein